jgi:hypothetical protein
VGGAVALPPGGTAVGVGVPAAGLRLLFGFGVPAVGDSVLVVDGDDREGFVDPEEEPARDGAGDCAEVIAANTDGPLCERPRTTIPSSVTRTRPRPTARAIHRLGRGII